MVPDVLTTYPSWDLTRPVIPPRSRLYHLEPVGIGTPDVESLTGYVARLAQAHSVSTRKLLVREIVPLLGRPHLLGPRGNEVSSFWNRNNLLNGTRTVARDMVHALEALTLHGELRFLTMLTWAAVLPPRDLVRTNRAWCPVCYEEWHRAGRIVYEPLLWSLAPVAACLRHRRRLRQTCPHHGCQQPSLPVTSRSRPGYCARCGRWLGISPQEGPVGREALTEDELRSQAWIVRALGELLAAAPRLPGPPERRQVTQAIAACVEQTTGGSAGALACELGLEPGTLVHWRSGYTIPCLWPLLRLCHRLGLTPLQLLTNDVLAVAPVGSSVPELQQPPRRFVAARQALNLSEVRRTLEAVLASGEFPPPSMRDIARRLGRDHVHLHRRLPGLCRAISARYLDYRKGLARQKRQQLYAEIRQAVFEVHGQGLYPSAYRVSRLISQPGFIRGPEARSVWQESLRELGWRV